MISVKKRTLSWLSVARKVLTVNLTQDFEYGFFVLHIQKVDYTQQLWLLKKKSDDKSLVCLPRQHLPKYNVRKRDDIHG